MAALRLSDHRRRRGGDLAGDFDFPMRQAIVSVDNKFACVSMCSALFTKMQFKETAIEKVSKDIDARTTSKELFRDDSLGVMELSMSTILNFATSR